MREVPASFEFSPAFVPPPTRLLPEGKRLLVLGCHLDVEDERLEAMRATFSPREEQRYKSFATDPLRRRWGASRGFLRAALGSALRIPPAELAFVYGEHGKPRLDDSQQPRGGALRFNLSHSGALAILALGRGYEVGADVELPRQRRIGDLARRWYTEAEQHQMFSTKDQAATFFRLWTCKEAFLKATGEGLSRSLRSYEVELTPQGARLRWAREIPDAATRYSIYPLRPGEPYFAAVVAESQELTVSCHRWP